MKKEDFVALGISEELAEKAAEKSAAELKGFVPRDRLNEATKAKEQAEASYSSVKAELDKLKTSAGDNEALQLQIKQLQEDLKVKEKDHAAEIANMKMTNAIQAAIGGAAQDAELVAGLLDRSKLILSDDGKVTGLEDQINGLKETKPFLFKDSEKYPNVQDKGEIGKHGKHETRDLFAEALNGAI